MPFHSWRRTSGISKTLFLSSEICFEIGQPHDQDVSDVTVENLAAENTGDDSLALFNVVADAKISNCYIRYRVGWIK